jgi:hypothetical protein
MKNNIRLYFFQFYIFIFVYFFFQKNNAQEIYIYKIWKKKYSNTYEKNIELLIIFSNLNIYKYEFNFH